MNKKIAKFLRFLGFLGAGAIIFWLVYKGQDISRIKSILANEVDYFWVWVSVALGLLSHVSRTVRWRLMIEPLGRKPGFFNTFLAVMIGYLMNLAIPRMGEISRCGVLSRYENISFPKLAGTVVTERIADVVMMLLFTLVALLMQFGVFRGFLHNNPSVGSRLGAIISSPWLFLTVAVIAFACFAFRKKVKNTKIFAKARELGRQFGEGLKTVKNMRRKGAFIGHSFVIWLMYYLMLYVYFFAFDFTSHLSAVAGLTTFVLSSYGMAAPVQGGIGTWHFMVIQALIIYGVSKADALVFAFLAHSVMTAMFIVVGLGAMLALPFINHKRHVGGQPGHI